MEEKAHYPTLNVFTPMLHIYSTMGDATSQSYLLQILKSCMMTRIGNVYYSPCYHERLNSLIVSCKFYYHSESTQAQAFDQMNLHRAFKAILIRRLPHQLLCTSQGPPNLSLKLHHSTSSNLISWVWPWIFTPSSRILQDLQCILDENNNENI